MDRAGLARRVAFTPERTAEAARRERPRLLCVDDEPQILNAFTRVFTEDYDVDTATTANEALAALARPGVDYDVILTDMRMPGMNGAALLTKVRALRPDTVRLLLTGDVDVRAASTQVNEADVFRFLTKPCPSATLRKALADAVEHHRLVSSVRVREAA